MRSTDRSPFRKEIENALAEVGPYRSIRARLQISGFLDVGYNWVVSLTASPLGDYLVDRVEIEEEKIKPNLSAARSKSVGDFLGRYGRSDRIIVSPQRTVYVINYGSDTDPFNKTNLEVTKGKAVLEAKKGLTLTYPSGIAEVVEGLVLVFEPHTASQLAVADTGERRRREDKIPTGKNI